MKIKSLFFTLILLSAFSFSLAAQESNPLKFSITTDAAYYPKSDYVAGDTHFAPLTGIYSGVEGRVSGNMDYTISTPLGEHWVHFKDDSPYGWQAFTESKAAWCSYITGGFYIHSILYAKNYSYNLSPGNTPILDGDLGYNLSHSCIRLKTENAKWVYDNIPLDTKVVVFESTYDYED